MFLNRARFSRARLLGRSARSRDPPASFVEALPGLRSDHFERRPHRAGHRVAAAGRAIGKPQHDVDVKLGLPSSPTAMSPIALRTSHCSLTSILR